jgi:hypothetical protein
MWMNAEDNDGTLLGWLIYVLVFLLGHSVHVQITSIIAVAGHVHVHVQTYLYNGVIMTNLLPNVWLA